jgi:hypothetical protein
MLEPETKTKKMFLFKFNFKERNEKSDLMPQNADVIDLRH